MAQATQTYRRSLSGSVGAGMKSVFGGGGRTYYMLVHKVSSKYHKAGESQPIIVDEIEIGRDPRCQVRFDDSFTTVSRRHAAIVKDGDQWKLIQLSTTNSTYLNGHHVHKEWYLQNGDEIQLSTNGPKLGFIIPEGDKGKVSSIGLTARLNLFRQQALRPYKTALTILASVLVLAIAGLVWMGIHSDKVQKELNQQIAGLIKENKDNQKVMDSLGLELEKNAAKMKDYEEKMQKTRNQLAAANKKIVGLEKQLDNVITPTIEGFEAYMPSIYFCVFVAYVDGSAVSACSGTGFLLDDGRFVTAQHVVNGFLLYPDQTNSESLLLNIILTQSPELVTYRFIAVSASGDRIEKQFPASKHAFKMGHYDLSTLGTVSLDGMEMPIKGALTCDERDYAYFTTSKKGTIPSDAAFSSRMPAGTKLFAFGFPQGVGAEDIDKIQPIFSESSVAREGLDTDGCILLSNSETDHGNSGGPVFAKKDGKIVAIGILSGANRLGSKTGSGYGGKWKDRVVPMSALR